MSDYTPTTDEAFDATLYTWLDWKCTFENESDARAARDRMIAEVERAAAEKAWLGGAESAFYNPEIRGYVDYPDENPYRREETE